MKKYRTPSLKKNSTSFSPIFRSKELNNKLDIFCGIMNINKTEYCQKILLEKVSEDINKVREFMNIWEDER